MAVRFQGGKAVPVESETAKRARIEEARRNHPAMLMAKELQREFGGGNPTMAMTTSSVYFSILKNGKQYQIRVADHGHNPQRQGAGSGIININVQVSMGIAFAKRTIREVIDGKSEAFAYKVGQMVKHKSGVIARVVAIDPAGKRVQMDIGKGLNWYLTDFAFA